LGLELHIDVVLNSILDGGVWSASPPDRFTREATGILWIGN
jgi:hypothetical protein